MTRYASRNPFGPRIQWIVDLRRDREAKAGWSHMCLMCRTLFERRPTGRRRTYCSNACRQKHYRQHRRAVHGRDFYIARRERAARSLLRQAERYRGGRVDDTPIWPGFLNTPRTGVLFDLYGGVPLDFCQWCAKPMTRPNWLGPRYRCCSQACNRKWHAFRFRLHDALIRVDNRIDPIVKFRLSLFSLYSREPQPVFRGEVRVCDHCVKPYPVKGFTSRFCSKRCRQAAWRQTVRTCKFCGSSFKVDPRNRWKHVYCSNACRQSFVWRAAHPALADRPCAFCGTLFTPDKSNAHKQMYCSTPCRLRHQRRVPPYHAWRSCVECGHTFEVDQHNRVRRIYCSPRCKRQAYLHRKQMIPLPEIFTLQPTKVPLRP